MDDSTALSQSQVASAQTMGLETFTLFGQLPFELRNLVWEEMVPEDVPGLGIAVPLHKYYPPHTIPPPAVHMAYPAIMHTCADSRRVARRKIEFCFTSGARYPVPTRKFRPDIDALYICAIDICSRYQPIELSKIVPVARPRHLTVEIKDIWDVYRLGEDLKRFEDDESLGLELETVSVVTIGKRRIRPVVGPLRLLPPTGPPSHPDAYWPAVVRTKEEWTCIITSIFLKSGLRVKEPLPFAIKTETLQ